jgi:hypothetical protein
MSTLLFNDVVWTVAVIQPRKGREAIMHAKWMIAYEETVISRSALLLFVWMTWRNHGKPQ